MEPTTEPHPMSDRDKDRAEMDEARRRHKAHFGGDRPLTFEEIAGSPQCSPASPAQPPTARCLLLERARNLRLKALQLEALADQLPVRMTSQAAQGLARLLLDSW